MNRFNGFLLSLLGVLTAALSIAGLAGANEEQRSYSFPLVFLALALSLFAAGVLLLWLGNKANLGRASYRPAEGRSTAPLTTRRRRFLVVVVVLALALIAYFVLCIKYFEIFLVGQGAPGQLALFYGIPVALVLLSSLVLRIWTGSSRWPRY